MKKFLFLLVAFVAFAASTYAQSDTLYYKADKVNFRFKGEQYIGWQKCSIPVEFIGVEHKINIYTINPHYIDYGELHKEVHDTYTYIYAYGTDTYYEATKIEWFLYNSGTTIIKLSTQGYEVKYNIVPYEYEDFLY